MSFDIEAATDAYIDGLGEEALAQAAAYTTGNHWLMLGSLLVTAIVTLIIIRTGILTKVADKLRGHGSGSTRIVTEKHHGTFGGAAVRDPHI